MFVRVMLHYRACSQGYKEKKKKKKQHSRSGILSLACKPKSYVHATKTRSRHLHTVVKTQSKRHGRSFFSVGHTGLNIRSPLEYPAHAPSGARKPRKGSLRLLHLLIIVLVALLPLAAVVLFFI